MCKPTSPTVVAKEHDSEDTTREAFTSKEAATALQINNIRKSLPAIVFEKNIMRSLYYFVFDFSVVIAAFYLIYFLNHSPE